MPSHHLFMLVLLLVSSFPFALLTAEDTADSDGQLLEEQALSELSGDSIQRLNAMLIKEYIKRADAVEAQLKNMAKLADKIYEVTQETLDNETGRKIGTKVEAVRAFIAFEQTPIVTSTEIDLHQQRLEPIRQGIIEYASVPKLFKPSEVAEIKKLADEESWANTNERELENRKTRMQAIFKLRPAGNVGAGEPTLRERVEEVMIRMEQEEITKVAAAREKGRSVAITETAKAAEVRELQIGKEKAENELRMMKLEIEKLKAEFKLLEANKQSVIQEANQKVQDREKLTQLEDIKILAKLRPFTAQGYWQPGDRSRGATLRKSPMSFSRLEQFGALSGGHDGLARLLAVANGKGMGRTIGRDNLGIADVPATYSGTFNKRKHVDTDRPKWAYPPTYGELTTEQLIKVQEVQDLLIELGPTMVEQGLLAP